MENQENIKTVTQAVEELVHFSSCHTEIEKKLQNQELRISSLETNMELMLTKNTIVQEISNTVNGNEKEVSEELRRMKEENEKTRKELEVHENQIENNTLNIKVQRYLIKKMKKKMKKTKNDCTVNEEVIKELIQEEFKKKYLQKIKDEIEKNKKENTNPSNTNPIEEQPYNNVAKQPHNVAIEEQPHNVAIKESNNSVAKQPHNVAIEEQPENNPIEEQPHSVAIEEQPYNSVAKQPHNVAIVCPIEITIDTKYIEQLEEWTNRKLGNILFDSNKDNWKVNTSVFEERIMNNEHIIIIIDDLEGNKFGGYVNSKIDKVGEWINDSKSFVFSLESNGRLYEMMKFDNEEPKYAFKIYNQTDNQLFSFGNGWDIVVYKANNKTKSYCEQNSFEYNGIENTLCGKEIPERFTPKRIIVIEMK
ncbi:trichohyalin, putative [Entamoeba histolytica]